MAYYTSQTLSAAFIPIAVWDPSESSRFKSTMGGSGSVQKSQSQRRPVPKTNSPWPESLGDINSQPFGEVYRERERNIVNYSELIGFDRWHELMPTYGAPNCRSQPHNWPTPSSSLIPVARLKIGLELLMLATSILFWDELHPVTSTRV